MFVMHNYAVNRKLKCLQYQLARMIAVPFARTKISHAKCLCLLKLAHFTGLLVIGVTLPQKVVETKFSTDWPRVGSAEVWWIGEGSHAKVLLWQKWLGLTYHGNSHRDCELTAALAILWVYVRYWFGWTLPEHARKQDGGRRVPVSAVFFLAT